ncbi:MAG: hypothetical protein LBV75_03985 [Paludibacter sp.]|jgi:hypothetical protein|nr:hypothetical protein [Paludibacter sp.]
MKNLKQHILSIIAKYRREYRGNILRYKKLNRNLITRLNAEYHNDCPKAQNTEKIVYFVCNGKINHFGLADRLRGLVTVYQECKRANVKFAIHFVHPFRLQDYLQPNKYNWLDGSDEISYNKTDSIPFCYFLLDSFIKIDDVIYKKIKSVKNKQIHFYTNSWYSYHNNFGESFNELFRPSDTLQHNIDYYLTRIGGKYIALHFRFMSLLGDFNEYGITLNETERKTLIDKCIGLLLSVRQQNADYKSFFVCSDSITFLNEAAKFDFVHVAEGTITHCDNTNDSSFETHLKTFLDLFLLSKADKILSFATKEMRLSGLPQIASYFGNRPYERITIE